MSGLGWMAISLGTQYCGSTAELIQDNNAE